jgi:NHLM bacteriocin system ABC transporter ATP-binding protein
MTYFGTASSFADAGARALAVDGRDQLDLGASEAGWAVAQGMVNVFAAPVREGGEAGRRIYLGTVAPGGFIPPMGRFLAGTGATAVAVPDGRATVLPEPAGAGADPEVQAAAEAFARVMLPPEVRAASAASGDALGALGIRIAALVSEDANSVSEAVAHRARQPEAGRGAFRQMLGAIFAGRDEVLNVSPSLPVMLRACRHVAVAAGVPLSAIPRRLPNDPLTPAPEAFAGAARIGCRRSGLPDGWWRSDCGPLLGFQEGNRPVAMVPSRWGGYRAFAYEPGKQPRAQRVDAAFARSLAAEAVVFDAPLPAGATTVRSLFAFLLRGCAPDLLAAAAVSAAGSALNLAVPFATGLLVSRVIPSGDSSTLAYLGLVLGSTILATAMFELVTSFLLLRVEGRLAMRGASAILLRALRLPLEFFQRHSVGELSERLGALEELERRVTGSMVSAVIGGVFSLTYLVLMMAIDPLAGLVSMAAFGALFAVTALVARRQARWATDAAERSGRLGGFSLQLIAGVERIRTTCTEEAALVQWLQRYRPERRSMYLASLAGAWLRVVGVSVPFAAAGLLWWRFVSVPGTEEARVASFMSFNAAFSAALAGITALGYAIGDFAESAPLLGRLRPILEAAPEATDQAEAAGRLSGAVALKDVRFAYPGSPGEVLRGVSFEALPGDFVAVVGASGSGKSTLVQILLGLRRPTAGKVLFDGQDLSKLDPVSVRRQVGVVGQHSKVLPGSIMENIVGASLLSPEDAWEAAEAAGLADDIRAMPMQMHTFVNEQTLSGGQLQKLLIARALATRPRILVFDEATSALDEVSQGHVSRNLESLAVTRIVIAHRLSTVRRADRILVLVRGEIAQTGTFDELAGQEGPFRELVRRQLLEAPELAAGGSP